MKTTAIIETWGGDYTRIYQPGSTKVDAIKIDRQLFIKTGLIANLIKTYLNGYVFVSSTDCREICQTIATIVDYNPKRIAVIRGQIEAYDVDTTRLDDLEISYLDYAILEAWKEELDDTVNLWKNKLTLENDLVTDVLDAYLTRIGVVT